MTCPASSWKGQGHRPYGPGGYNQCVREAGHPGQHLDAWGNRWPRRMGPGQPLTPSTEEGRGPDPNYGMVEGRRNGRRPSAEGAR